MDTEKVWEIARDFVFAYEGGFQNHVEDPGNWTGGAVGSGVLKGTKFGISAASYPTLEIESLTPEQAQAIYRRDFWERNRCGDMPARFAVVAFDASVLQGVGQAAICLQRALGVGQDAQIGKTTLASLAVADSDTEDNALLRFFADRATVEDKTFLARPSMIAWAGNWEYRMFKLARLVFGPTFQKVV